LDPDEGFLRMVPEDDRIDYDMFGLDENGVSDLEGHPVTVSCPDQDPFTQDWVAGKPWVDSGGVNQGPVDATNLSGSYTETDDAEPATWTWNLDAA
jgi:hypothetical protein